MARIGIEHLSAAPGRTMVSFGQGCEGEPLTRAREIAQAIQAMRVRTRRGSININTNGSLPDNLALLIDAGLDACRISLNSAHKPLYEAYYQPINYGWEDVRESIRLARKRGVYTALNLLTFPGVTDQEGEAEKLCELVARERVDQVQARNRSRPVPRGRLATQRGRPADRRARAAPAVAQGAPRTRDRQFRPRTERTAGVTSAPCDAAHP